MFDPVEVRADFPILSREVRGQTLTYLDSAATAQKPEAVLQAMDRFYRERYGSVRRGLHALSEEATNAYQDARQTIADFLGASSADEIVFTRGATEAINLVAMGWGRRNLAKGDAILLTEMEHHANLVPWYFLAKEKELELRFVGLTRDGRLDLGDFDRQLDGAKLVAVTHASNVLGTINPITEIVERAHAVGAKVLVDGAQGAPHLPVSAGDLGADWYALAGHKLYGPSGIGVLRTDSAVYEEMDPASGGGEMITDVGLGTVDFAEPPAKFEAGSMPSAEAVGLAAAAEYLTDLGVEDVREHDKRLVAGTLERLKKIDGLTVHGPTDPDDRVGLVAFSIEGIHHHDLSAALDADGIAVRSGQHCAQPLHDRLGVPGTVRASFAVHTTEEEIGRFAESLMGAVRTLGVSSGRRTVLP